MKWLTCVLLTITIIKFIYCSPIENKLEKKSQISEDFIESQIVGGEVAPPGRFTYQVAINNDYGLFCSGVLISDSYILTAAHCIDGIFYLLAYLGVHNIRNRTDDWVELVLHRDSCQLHPDFNAAERSNDIAIIEIPEPVTLNEIITTIGLPYKYEKNFDYSYKYVTVTGWGYDTTDGEGLTHRLHYTQLKLLPHEVCEHFYLERMRTTNLCTENGMGQGICYGDSGAPIVYRRKDGTSALIGLASFISQIGCTSGWPSVFTRLDSYLDWIENVTGLKIGD